jgi:hypothetical protein
VPLSPLLAATQSCYKRDRSGETVTASTPGGVAVAVTPVRSVLGVESSKPSAPVGVGAESSSIREGRPQGVALAELCQAWRAGGATPACTVATNLELLTAPVSSHSDVRSAELCVRREL